VLVQEAGGTVLFSNGAARRWSDWETFVQRALKTPFGQDPAALRKLFIYMLAGNAQVVQQCAGQITLRRPSLWGKARRHLRRVWHTVKGKVFKGKKS